MVLIFDRLIIKHLIVTSIDKIFVNFKINKFYNLSFFILWLYRMLHVFYVSFTKKSFGLRKTNAYVYHIVTITFPKILHFLLAERFSARPAQYTVPAIYASVKWCTSFGDSSYLTISFAVTCELYLSGTAI